MGNTSTISLLQQLFDEGLLDITVLLPEAYFDKSGVLKNTEKLPDCWGDNEVWILHMHEVTGITLPGFRYDRRLSDANLEWEHIESATLHHPSILKHLEAEQ